MSTLLVYLWGTADAMKIVALSLGALSLLFVLGLGTLVFLNENIILDQKGHGLFIQGIILGVSLLVLGILMPSSRTIAAMIMEDQELVELLTEEKQ